MPVVRSRAGGVLIDYEDTGPPPEGQGSPLLLIMGLGADRTGWLRNREPLARRFRVIMHDNRGVGRSDKPPGPYRISDMALDALAVLDDARVDRAHVVGVSMGGLIAQELALIAPDRIRSLVLASTFARADESLRFTVGRGFVQLLRSMGRGPRAGTEGIGKEFLASRLIDQWLPLTFSPDFLETRRPEIDPMLAGWKDEAFAPHGFTAQLAAVLSFDSRSRLREVRAPTMVLASTQDRSVRLASQQALADLIPGARFVPLDPGGHGMNYELADAWNEIVLGFLDDMERR